MEKVEARPRGEPPAGASNGHRRVEVILGIAGKNSSPVSRRMAMAMLFVPISFLEVLPMRSLYFLVSSGAM